METVHALPLTVVLVAVAVAAATDLWTFRLHNVLTVPFFLLGALYHSLIGGTEGLAASVLGALVGAAPLIPLYARGGMGAGDLKLSAGIGAWLGAWHVLHVLIVAGLAMGIYAAGVTVWNRLRPTRSPQPRPGCVEQCLASDQAELAADISVVVRMADVRRRVVPFGAMLALGVVGTIVWIGV